LQTTDRHDTTIIATLVARDQAVARIADRTVKNCRGRVT